MNSTECLICYEKIKNTNFCITECNHVYCLTCIIKATLRKTECPYCKYKLLEIPENTEEEINENHVEEVNVQVFNNIEFSEYDEDDDSNYEGEEGNVIRRSYNLRSGQTQISGQNPRFIEVNNPNIENVRIIQNKKKNSRRNKKLMEILSLQKAINEIKLIENKVKNNENKKNKKEKINKNRSFKF